MDFDSIDEPEIAQSHSIDIALNGIAQVRSRLPQGESASHCLDCGVVIPEARREAMKGCKYCIECQPFWDKMNKGTKYKMC